MDTRKFAKIKIKPETGERLRAYRIAVGVQWSRHRAGRLLLLQILFAVVLLIGISCYSVPIALIIGGLGGVLAVERQ